MHTKVKGTVQGTCPYDSVNEAIFLHFRQDFCTTKASSLHTLKTRNVNTCITAIYKQHYYTISFKFNIQNRYFAPLLSNAIELHRWKAIRHLSGHEDHPLTKMAQYPVITTMMQAHPLVVGHHLSHPPHTRNCTSHCTHHTPNDSSQQPGLAISRHRL